MLVEVEMVDRVRGSSLDYSRFTIRDSRFTSSGSCALATKNHEEECVSIGYRRRASVLVVFPLFASLYLLLAISSCSLAHFHHTIQVGEQLETNVAAHQPRQSEA